jgi:CheY-like chemotaxis protein
MVDPHAATTVLRALHKMGVNLGLDDFGTGYSSLAHLKRFPFDAVKIDRSFVANIISNPEDAAIASAIIAMSHRLNLKVVAEGVETQGQFAYLRRLGCDGMQGFYFSPGVSSDEFEEQLQTGRCVALPVDLPEKSQSLLVVDDEPSICSALKRTLRRDGYRIHTASSGSDALKVLATNPIQVIISDQRMPEMTGTDFLHIVKELYPDTLRIILSGYTDLAVVTDSVNRGAVFKFLTKPWDDDLLREQVRDAFRRHQPAVAEH